MKCSAREGIIVLGIFLVAGGSFNCTNQRSEERAAKRDSSAHRDRSRLPGPQGGPAGKPALAPASDTEGFDGWRAMPIRSEAEYEAGIVGGEAEQHMQGMARSVSNPDIIYLSHDCGQVWRSRNNGASWQKTLNINLLAYQGNSIEVDPVDPDIVHVLMHANPGVTQDRDYSGLYRSTDGGDTWTFKVHEEQINTRRYAHNIAYDMASVNDRGAQVWYAAFENDRLYRSEDGGETWSPRAGLSGHTIVYEIHVHTANGNLYLATSGGLRISRDGGATVQPIGDLPAGEVSSIEIDGRNPGPVYAVVKGKGLYLSSDGGSRFSQLKSLNAFHVFINQGHPEVIFVVGAGGRADYTLVSFDSGGCWVKADTVPAAGLWRDTYNAGWKGTLCGPMTGISPDPRDPRGAVAFSRATVWKTVDGVTFNDSSTMLTGYNCGFWPMGFQFDEDNPDRFALFSADVGMAITENYGDWFERRSVLRHLLDISWSSMHGADFQPGTDRVVTAAGYRNSGRRLVIHDEVGDDFKPKDWHLADGNDGAYFFVTFDPGNPELVLAENRISNDGGETWNPIPGLEPYSYGKSHRNAVILGRCLTDPDILYALNGDRNTVLRSDDGGSSWYEYGSNPTPGGNFTLKDSKPTFAMDPVECGRVYAARSTDGDLYYYDGSTWTKTGVIDLVKSRYDRRNFVRSVVVDPRDNSVVYAGMYGAGTSVLWRSVDRGLTWKDITFNLPRLPAQGLTVNPRSGEIMRSACDGTFLFPPPYESSNLLYSKAASVPSCRDGLKNSDEEGVDCGRTCETACGRYSEKSGKPNADTPR
ncbi:hypothetical protein ACFL4G_05000 [Thermodesulfobacteriota bacterium]